ncbi:hypothetical protein J3458_021820 [Metarhizium acridum]|uniref:uncharacterized protein n=1 Tax=Metarhizium acridum TaxID=92637 RepID=UPI001C6CD150|nr:hypothetical protein J3458_021820 [Metarhizium acridum]
MPGITLVEEYANSYLLGLASCLLAPTDLFRYIQYRYSIPNFVEELQEGCNNILVHWHYYNCHPWPKPDDPWERHKHFMSELTSEQYDLVMDTMTDRRVQKQLAAWAKCRQENGMSE